MKKVLFTVVLLSSLGFAENNEIRIKGGFSAANFNLNDKTSIINQNTDMYSGAFIGIEYATVCLT